MGRRSPPDRPDSVIGVAGTDSLGPAVDSFSTLVLVVATLIVVAGGAVVLVREVTAPGRRRVGPVRDAIEVAFPIIALVWLVALVWTRF